MYAMVRIPSKPRLSRLLLASTVRVRAASFQNAIFYETGHARRNSIPTPIVLSNRDSSFLAGVVPRSNYPLLSSPRRKSITTTTMTNDSSETAGQPPSIESTTEQTANLSLETPSPPLSFLQVPNPDHNDASKYNSLTRFDLSSLTSTLLTGETLRETAYAQSRTLNLQILSIRSAMDRGETSDEIETKRNATVIFANDLIPSDLNPREPRVGNLNHSLEDLIRLNAYRHFLQTGKLLTLKECDTPAQDEEYLGGIICFSHDLSRYAIGRAILRDVPSVEMARDVISQLTEELLECDFRNGPLRRKYDGTKYALKRLETILYELSMTEARIAREGGGAMEVEPIAKRAKTSEGRGSVWMERVDRREMGEIRGRMERRDEMREKVIKRTRDSQKAAKRAIFALHRGDIALADKLLKDCESIAEELMPVIKEEPSLRYGSFANSLEEYAEAKLFAEWLRNQTLVRPDEVSVDLTPEEYLGGLCDLTGEIGRYAVAMGTKRDLDAVNFSLATNLHIFSILQLMDASPKRLSKKMDPLRMCVEKLEQLVYELSLIKAGRTAPVASVEAVNTQGQEEDR